MSSYINVNLIGRIDSGPYAGQWITHIELHRSFPRWWTVWIPRNLTVQPDGSGICSTIDVRDIRFHDIGTKP